MTICCVAILSVLLTYILWYLFLSIYLSFCICCVVFLRVFKHPIPSATATINSFSVRFIVISNVSRLHSVADTVGSQLLHAVLSPSIDLKALSHSLAFISPQLLLLPLTHAEIILCRRRM